MLSIAENQAKHNTPTPANWPEGELNFLIETGLKAIFQTHRHNPAILLNEAAQRIESRAKKYGPLPDVLRVWLVNHVNAIHGYEHAKAAFWQRVTTHYNLTPQAIGQGTPADERSVEPLQADHGQVLVDPEAYRWSYALGRGPQYMLYALAFSLARNNRVSINALAAAAGHSQSYFYELLALSEIGAGESPFYRGRDGDWLYLRSQQAIGQRLALLLVEDGLHKVLDGRRPGMRRRYVAFNADHPELFACWLGSKRSRRISRPIEAQLWNVEENTVRRWDKAAGIDAQRNYAQTADLRDERAPADREDYMLIQQDGQHVATWQQANTYHVKQTFIEHPHKGQARKVRKAISAVLSTEQPSKNLVEAHPFRIHNFAGGGDPLQAWKDYQRAVKHAPFAQGHDYLYRGQRQRARSVYRPAIWELMAHRPGQDCPRTTANQYLRVN